MDGLTSRGEMHIRRRGYIGVAPLPGGGVNVCTVREVSARRPVGAGDPARIMHESLECDPLLRERFAPEVIGSWMVLSQIDYQDDVIRFVEVREKVAG